MFVQLRYFVLLLAYTPRPRVAQEERAKEERKRGEEDKKNMFKHSNHNSSLDRGIFSIRFADDVRDINANVVIMPRPCFICTYYYYYYNSIRSRGKQKILFTPLCARSRRHGYKSYAFLKRINNVLEFRQNIIVPTACDISWWSTRSVVTGSSRKDLKTE